MADILFRRVGGTAPFARMAAPKFGLTYVERAGFNAWAEANNIVVLCACHACSAARRLASALRAELRARADPQIGAPRGGYTPTQAQKGYCWDGYGQSGPDYATQDGIQIATVRDMLRRLGYP